ncbi:MAG TPA: ABC transporter permease subunit [Symbiobacteriaceae bacterium]|nr:ABC transporter permease subunit [Symbiobacteriaceae bacterium]
MIARHFLRLQRGALVGWSLILFLLSLASGASAAAVQDQANAAALMNSLPPTLQKLAGVDLILGSHPVDGFLAMKWFLLLPVILGIYGALTAAAIVARENERGTIGYLLALPVQRGRLLRERFLTLAGALAWLYFVDVVGLLVGLKSVDLTGTPGRWALLMLGYYAVNLAQAGLTLLFSLYLPSWSRSVQAGAGLVIGLFLIDTGLAMADVPMLGRAPFLYGLTDVRGALLHGQLPWPALLVGLCLTILTITLAERRFARQQITA